MFNLEIIESYAFSKSRDLTPLGARNLLSMLRVLRSTDFKILTSVSSAATTDCKNIRI